MTAEKYTFQLETSSASRTTAELNIRFQVMYYVATVRAAGGGLACVNHGGEALIKSNLRRELARLKKRHEIVLYIPGSEFRTDDTATRYLADRISLIAIDPRLNAGDDTFTLFFVQKS